QRQGLFRFLRFVEAQIDETDIGGVKEGQESVLTLDAYPEIEVKAKVGHIYRESKIVNNVTIYYADILPKAVPEVFRSGMNANVRIVEQSRRGVLLVPSDAVKRDRETGSYVLLKKPSSKKPVRQKVETGMSDDTNTEILSGIGPADVLMIGTQKYNPAKGSKAASNPFMPPAPKKKSEGRTA
ncbi:MAG: efflux RND transporter periplasmic adaptor subunit, partial [Candidatus Omnitrophota bacterium]